jgi:hypothetical protein
MPLSAAQLADLVEEAKIVMGISDDDAAYHTPAIALYGDDAVLTSATVEVTDTALVLVDNVTGTTTLTLAGAANDTLSELVVAIDAVANWNATLLGRDSADSTKLVRKAATSALGQANEVTLLIENQELLELLITNIFDALEDVLCRNILSDSYAELYEWHTWMREVILRQPDVTQVTMVGLEKEDGLTVKYTGSDEIARVEVTNTAVVLVSRTGATTTTTTTLFSDQVTTTAMASTLNGVAGWTSTVVNARPSAFLERRGVQDAKDTQVTLETWDDSDCEYQTDYPAGILEFRDFPALADGPYVRVDYIAGLSAIPASLKQVILNVVKQQWDATRKDSTLEQERLGDYMYKVASGSGGMASRIDWSPFESVISKYRRLLP